MRFEIPYQVIGGTKFYERAEIKDAVAYLQLLANPADAISFVADRQLAAARDRPADPGAAALAREHDRRRRAGTCSPSPSAIPALGPAALQGGRPVRRRRWPRLRERAERGGPVAELLEATLHETGYIEALEAERTIEAEGRIENLEELVGVAGEFDANRELEGESGDAPAGGVPRADLAASPSRTSSATTESLATLMSLHNAKGLEYEAVFMIGCEEGVFPHSRSLEEGNLEEERRLCYVGVTRARERLCLTYARRRIAVRRRELEPAVALPRRAPRAAGRAPRGDHADRLVARRRRRAQRATGFGERRRGDGFAAPERKQPAPPPVPYAVGDDVVHASFGEGVVTAVEAGRWSSCASRATAPSAS